MRSCDFRKGFLLEEASKDNGEDEESWLKINKKLRLVDQEKVPSDNRLT